MDNFTEEMDSRWFETGFAFARKNSAYPFKSEVVPSDISPKNALPQIIDEFGIDRTPIPLFPVFAKRTFDYVIPDETLISEAISNLDIEQSKLGPSTQLPVKDEMSTKAIDLSTDDTSKQTTEFVKDLDPKRKESLLTQLWAMQNFHELRTWLKMEQIILGPDSVPAEALKDQDEVVQEVEKEEIVKEETEEDELIAQYLAKVGGDHQRKFSIWEEDPFISLTISDKEQAEREKRRRDAEQLKNKAAYEKEWEIAIKNLKQEEILVEAEIEDDDAEDEFATFDHMDGKTADKGLWEPREDMIVSVEFARNNIIFTESDTINFLDIPDYIVKPEFDDYRKVLEKNIAYKNALERYESSRLTEDNLLVSNSVQTTKVILKDEYAATEPLPLHKDSGGLIDEYSVFQTYAEEKVSEEVEDSSKMTLLNDYSSFLKYLQNNKDKFLPYLYLVEKALNQNSYGELLSACNKPPEVIQKALPSIGNRKSSVFDFISSPPKLNRLLSIKYDVGSAKHSITCICFNFSYSHYFAAGFNATSSLNRAHENFPPGYIVCWDIRHFQVPEAVFETPQIVTCLEFSKTTPHLLAAGMRNGLLAIFDISQNDRKPLVDNYVSHDKPYGDVSKVKWSKVSQDKLGVICVCTDGKIYQWLPSGATRASNVKSYSDSKLNASGTEKSALEVGIPFLCFDLKPDNPEICVIGTVTGEIIQTTVLGHAIRTHKRHCGPVNEIRWSPFVKDVFVSCAFDSSVCLWEALKPEPCRTFYVSNQKPVLNLDWSNTSSSLFGVVTATDIKIFDMSLSKVGELVETSTIDAGEEFTCITFFPYGNWFFVGRTDGIIEVYDVVNVPTKHLDPEHALRSAFLT